MRTNPIPTLAACLALAACAASGLAAPARPAPAAAPARPAAKPRTLELVYGDDHAFGLVPPEGWVLDDSSGMASKIRVVLYPRGQKWDSSPVVMYSNPLHQDPRAKKTLAEMIDRDVADFRKHSPRGKVTPAPDLPVAGGRQATVRYFAPDGGAPRTAVAYVEERGMVMLLVLDARKSADFAASLPAFRDLVASYQFIASNIRTPTRPGQSK